MHATLPVTFLNLPAAHGLQGPPFGPLNPISHTQLPRAVLATGEVVFAGQLRHAALPVALLYVPATHAVHAVFGPVKPAAQGGGTVHGPPGCPTNPELHVQFVTCLLVDGDILLAGHGVQLSQEAAVGL
jgi:hypothetical protein